MKIALFSLFLFLASNLIAQDTGSMLDQLGDESATEYAKYNFKTNRVINGHSIENTAKGVLDFKISHRFGFVNGGAYQLFGLDQATQRFGFDYGITDWLQVGVGRNSTDKLYDGYLKVKFLRQSKGKRVMPISMAYVGGVELKTVKFSDENRINYFTSRLYYYHQLLIASKITDGFTLQVMPTLAHRNLVSSNTEKNDVYSIGVAARQKLSARIAVNVEYYYVLPNQLATGYVNGLSLGFDIETGGHVFQVFFTNSNTMAYNGFVTETNGKWSKGDIRFGFNVSRVFTIVKPKGF